MVGGIGRGEVVAALGVERLGVEQAAAPESQVGNRRYARGRAYARDHYAEGQAAASEPEQTSAADAPEGKQESTE